MLTFSLDNKSDEPMYHQIYSYVKEEILSGRLSCGEKLPSARELAGYLSVSRNPVDTAYEQLVAEGYVYSLPKRGYFVNQITYTQQIHPAEYRDEGEEKDRENYRYDFDPDAVDVENFPYSVWQSIGRRALKDHSLFQAGDYRGDWELRRAVADYLHGSRGVLCQGSNVIIGAGIGYLLQLLSVMFRNEKRIAFEEPGYVRAKKILASHGFEVCDIGVEGGGIGIGGLEGSGARLCYVTPSHQFPLGTVMSIARRQQLLLWAKEEEDRYIIEDDHDSEYRYKGRPIPALQSIDAEGKVIYIGTFSKAIAPALRMGYMVLPDRLVKRFQECCGDYNCPVSRLDQTMMAEFIHGGYFEKHLNRMRKRYKEKHDTVLGVFRSYQDRIEVTGDYAGLYVIARSLRRRNEEELIQAARKQGIRLRPLSFYYKELPENYMPSFLIGFAGQTKEKLKEGLHILCEEVF